eukprot:TRINITY_DN5845_c0_g2_i1.p1 TRINITY_DN5845_c0_g2~~TRINITY_DN5845_c0_g2_i1.p1  ORF type:complete len:306 (+),score=42.08 TRINITY_DN5845_c0_g2_i1:69-920(+)
MRPECSAPIHIERMRSSSSRSPPSWLFVPPSSSLSLGGSHARDNPDIISPPYFVPMYFLHPSLPQIHAEHPHHTSAHRSGDAMMGSSLTHRQHHSGASVITSPTLSSSSSSSLFSPSPSSSSNSGGVPQVASGAVPMDVSSPPLSSRYVESYSLDVSAVCKGGGNGTCLLCARRMPESMNGRSSWSDILRVCLFSLRYDPAQSKIVDSYVSLKHELYPFLLGHWDILCHGKTTDTKMWHRQIQDALSHRSTYFESGSKTIHHTGYWRLHKSRRGDPWMDIPQA